jgi:hypothetical protein
MQVTRKNVLKVVFTTLGAIFVGAIGSGVWEGLLGPGMRAGRNWVLDSVSLLFRNFKNDIYTQIARDHFSAVNIESFFLVLMLYVGMWSAVIFYFTRAFRDLQDRHDILTRRVERDLGVTPDAEMTLEQMGEELKTIGRSIKQAWKYVYILIGLAAIFFTSHVISIARATYIDLALSNYHQVLTIASPYLNANEQPVIQSEFAQIQNRQEYAEIVGRLAAAAKAHGQSVPNFDPW